MRKSVILTASLALALLTLPALSGCVVPGGPSRVVLTPEGQPRFPNRSDGPYRLTLVNNQPEAIYWTVVVYPGSQRLEDVVDSQDGTLRFRDGAAAVFGVGPRLGRLVAMGVVQLGRGAYTAVGIPKTGLGRVLCDRPLVYTFTTVGWGMNSSYTDGDLRITSDALWVLPWADIQMRNPLNFDIRLPSVGEQLVEALASRPAQRPRVVAAPVPLPGAQNPATKDDLPHRFFGNGGDEKPLAAVPSSPGKKAEPAALAAGPARGVVRNGLTQAAQVKIYGARLQTFDLAPGASQEVALDAPGQMVVAIVGGREVWRRVLQKPASGSVWELEVGR